MKKKGKDLKPGDITVFHGLITDIQFPPHEKESDVEFWKDKPFYASFDVQDAFYGQNLGVLQLDEEYTVMEDKEEIRRIYNKIAAELAKYITHQLENLKLLGEMKDKIC